MASLHPIPPDNTSYRFPVSVKGIIYHHGKVVLLKNERDEWELPGGKLEPGESPESAVTREIEEELGLTAQTGPLLDSWVYHIFEGVSVLILSYGCYPTPFAQVTHSLEHKAVGQFTPEEIPHLNMPEGYKKSIASWVAYLQQTNIR
ncbi:NUDIX hydrolase [Tengunoibacter tsumagoiensis]|uniref:NUDIX hydrolase n=1 Tax=Tengunoibacter tsumagoiensis TaxID=2014871 RepID=A0A402A7A3_9CHLR|nr:NUDIX domain-containing protein [Tengunoibacter tsumagoiensis]GCE14988.1 NUDIX hydrolase [Tengunoibacter tsumagoiensis]